MIPDQPLPPVHPKRTPPAAAPATTMSPLVARYVNACQHILTGPHGRPVHAWLHRRGLDDATIVANRIGAEPGRRYLPRSRGLPYGAGPAAVLPALDAGANLTYVQARYLDPDATGRKYDNPAAALAPHPRLAFPTATESRGGVLLVCEGLPDALIAAQAGYRAVALLGANTPDAAVAARLANHAANHGLGIAIVCDPDHAGWHVAATLTDLLANHDTGSTVIRPPDGLDLNAWALADPSWSAALNDQIGGRPAVAVDNGVDL
jgi:DNA primase